MIQSPQFFSQNIEVQSRWINVPIHVVKKDSSKKVTSSSDMPQPLQKTKPDYRSPFTDEKTSNQKSPSPSPIIGDCLHSNDENLGMPIINALEKAAHPTP